jgi:hypothetical protein
VHEPWAIINGSYYPKIVNWGTALYMLKSFFIRTMNKNVVPAIAAISGIALAGAGGWSVLNPHETSTEPTDSTVTAYPPFGSTALFPISDNHHFSGDDGLPLPLYIYSADNYFIRDMREVLAHEKK